MVEGVEEVLVEEEEPLKREDRIVCGDEVELGRTRRGMDFLRLPRTTFVLDPGSPSSFLDDIWLSRVGSWIAVLVSDSLLGFFLLQD